MGHSVRCQGGTGVIAGHLRPVRHSARGRGADDSRGAHCGGGRLAEAEKTTVTQRMMHRSLCHRWRRHRLAGRPHRRGQAHQGQAESERPEGQPAPPGATRWSPVLCSVPPLVYSSRPWSLSRIAVHCTSRAPFPGAGYSLDKGGRHATARQGRAARGAGGPEQCGSLDRRSLSVLWQPWRPPPSSVRACHVGAPGRCCVPEGGGGRTGHHSAKGPRAHRSAPAVRSWSLSRRCVVLIGAPLHQSFGIRGRCLQPPRAMSFSIHSRSRAAQREAAGSVRCMRSRRQVGYPAPTARGERGCRARTALPPSPHRWPAALPSR